MKRTRRPRRRGVSIVPELVSVTRERDRGPPYKSNVIIYIEINHIVELNEPMRSTIVFFFCSISFAYLPLQVFKCAVVIFFAAIAKLVVQVRSSRQRNTGPSRKRVKRKSAARSSAFSFLFLPVQPYRTNSVFAEVASSNAWQQFNWKWNCVRWFIILFFFASRFHSSLSPSLFRWQVRDWLIWPKFTLDCSPKQQPPHSEKRLFIPAWFVVVASARALFRLVTSFSFVCSPYSHVQQRAREMRFLFSRLPWWVFMCGNEVHTGRWWAAHR